MLMKYNPQRSEIFAGSGFAIFITNLPECFLKVVESATERQTAHHFGSLTAAV